MFFGLTKTKTTKQKLAGMSRKKKSKMYEKIVQHGENIKEIFDLPTSLDPIALSKSIKRIETLAERIVEDYANGLINENEMEKKSAQILKKLDTQIKYKSAKVPVFLNTDPRGYALKIEDDFVSENKLSIFRDFGGYGILSPDFSSLGSLIRKKETKEKVATKATKKTVKNTKFSQYAKDIKLGAILIKDGKVTNMRMSSMAKMIKEWNSKGRPGSLEDFIKKNAKKLLKKSPATKKTTTPKKKIKKTVVKKTFKEVEEDLPF